MESTVDVTRTRPPAAGRAAKVRAWTPGRVAGTVGGVALGAVLLVAAWAKALDPAAFAATIRAEGLDLLLPAGAVAMIALALEVGLGVALVLGVRRTWVLLPVTLLVAFLSVLTGRTYWRAEHGLVDPAASCGCFGNLVERSPAEAFWQDLLLLVPPLLLAWVARDRPLAGARRFPPVRSAIVAVVVAGTLAFAWKAPELPLDDLATRLHPGVRVADLCAGQGAGRVCLDGVVAGLDQGRHYVAVVDLEGNGWGAVIDPLNDYALSGRTPGLVVLAAASPAQLNAFYFEWGPSFDIHEAPAALLRPLYRRLPRSFLVEDGEVTRTFNGLPPALVPATTGSTGGGT